jgi:cytochrome d ubiquinol oxidase subunit I
MAVTFAVGAVTGTVLTFEFGLLWPRFMDRYGAAFGIAFGIEGIFFFLEAIFLAIYIYGWKRLSGWAHFWAGVPMVITGIGGAFSVVAANSWMNQPQGFTLGAGGRVVDTDPTKVLLNPATGYEVPHMILAAYIVVGFLVASIYAVGMLRGRRDRLHRLGLAIPLTIGLIAAPLQFLVGDTAARAVADNQPAKFAGMECVQNTGEDQTEYLGGICTSDGVKGSIPIPDLDSILVGFSPHTKVTGLNSIPPDERPPANTLLHLAFDTMVGICTLMIALGAWVLITWWRHRRLPSTAWFLRAVAVSGAAAVLSLWCGWLVTEVGRQPWIVWHYMRTSEALTPAKGIWFSFGLVLALYAGIGTVAILVLRGMSRRWREGGAEPATPYEVEGSGG